MNRRTVQAGLLLALLQVLHRAWAQTAQEGDKFPISYSDASFARDCVGRETEELFVLSFDDGPWEQTQYILDILDEKQAPATFFVIGSNFDRFPALKLTYESVVNRILREDHIVANHGMTNDEFTIQDVEDCHEEIMRVANDYEMKYFRPAQGAYTKEKYEELVRMGYTFAMWNLDTVDWRSDRDPNEALAELKIAIQNPTTPASSDDVANAGFPRRGSFIMLAHDNHDTMIQEVEGGGTLLGAMIDAIREEGYTIISLDECLGQQETPYDLGTKFCGSTWEEAASCEMQSCPSGQSEECPTGQACYDDIENCGDDYSGGQRLYLRHGVHIVLGLLVALLLLEL